MYTKNTVDTEYILCNNDNNLIIHPSKPPGMYNQGLGAEDTLENPGSVSETADLMTGCRRCKAYAESLRQKDRIKIMFLLLLNI